MSESFPADPDPQDQEGDKPGADPLQQLISEAQKLELINAIQANMLEPVAPEISTYESDSDGPSTHFSLDGISYYQSRPDLQVRCHVSLTDGSVSFDTIERRQERSITHYVWHSYILSPTQSTLDIVKIANDSETGELLPTIFDYEVADMEDEDQWEALGHDMDQNHYHLTQAHFTQVMKILNELKPEQRITAEEIWTGGL